MALVFTLAVNFYTWLAKFLQLLVLTSESKEAIITIQFFFKEWYYIRVTRRPRTEDTVPGPSLPPVLSPNSGPDKHRQGIPCQPGGSDADAPC